MDECRRIAEELGPEVLQMSKATWDTDREVAISVCENWDYNAQMGSADQSTVDRCGDERVNIHTHPPGNPVRASRMDLGDFMRTQPGDYVDRMCIVGAGYPTKMRCLELDRSDLSREEYVEMVNEINDDIKDDGSSAMKTLDEDWSEISSCEVYLE